MRRAEAGAEVQQGIGAAARTAVGANRDLRADMCLDAALLRHGVEARNAIEAIAVGEGDGGHSKLGRALDKRFRLRGRGQKAEGARGVQFDVFVAVSHNKLPGSTRSACNCEPGGRRRTSLCLSRPAHPTLPRSNRRQTTSNRWFSTVRKLP